jgi:hypothetical protein
MKKQLLSLGICLALLQVSNTAEAQTFASAESAPAITQVEDKQPAESQAARPKTFATKASDSGFEAGDILISPGLSFGAIYGYGGAGFLPLSLSAEYSLNDKFALGAYVGYASGSSSNLLLNSKWTSFSFGGKGTLHATGLLNQAFGSSMDAEKIDLFASAYLGIRTFSYSQDFIGASGTTFTPGLTIGGRYFFTPNIGAFLELGYGAIGAGTLGVSFRL